MSFATDIKEEIEKQKVWDNNSILTQEEQINRICVREAFLKSGFINDPNKEYHLEIVFKTKKKCEQIKNILQEYSINARTIKRGNNYILYLKDGEEISNFLALIGANSSVLKFEEIRVIKDTRNNINRLVNCETANINKIITAAVTQIKAIEHLKQINKFNDLPNNLKEIANLRLKNPDSSLEELGKMLKKPIGKSGVNHRLNKIIEIANETKK